MLLTSYQANYNLAVAYLPVLSQPLDLPTASLHTHLPDILKDFKFLKQCSLLPLDLQVCCALCLECLLPFIQIISVYFQVLGSFRKNSLFRTIAPLPVYSHNTLDVLYDGTFHIGLLNFQTGAHPALLTHPCLKVI